nr:hypothetical protein [Variovorax boronicumulans]
MRPANGLLLGVAQRLGFAAVRDVVRVGRQALPRAFDVAAPEARQKTTGLKV